MVDFKSYAGRQTIGPFHKSFSAVVGPNGSGKSNVIDALLFVFGWRANKMRQGKLSELIHHSAAHEDLPQCSVEIWFREIEDLPGPDAYRVVPNSRLVVARTAFRNNTSVYTVNGCKSTFGEVGALLRSHGIDLDHKRFLILQGEVESIAQMPPKGKTEHEEGLLEYLEDIIGTSDFNKPIEEAAAKVDLANEQRSLKLDRLKYVQKEKQALEVCIMLRTAILPYPEPYWLTVNSLHAAQEGGSRGVPARPKRVDPAQVDAVANLHDGVPPADGDCV